MVRPIRFLLAASLAVAAVAGDAPAPAAAPEPGSPEAAVLAPVQALRQNDLLAIFKALPAEAQDDAKTGWADAQKTPNPDDDAKTDSMLQLVNTPQAVDTLMATVEPQLKQLDPNQLALQVQAGAGMLAMMLAGNPESLPFGEALQGIATDVVAWLPKSGVDDPVKARALVENLVAAAKAYEVQDSAALHALSLDQMLERSGKALALVKQGLDVYGCDLDAFLDSIAVTNVKGDGDHRTADVQFTVLGKPHSLPLKLVQKDGHWVADSSTLAPLQQMAPGAQGGGDAQPTTLDLAAPKTAEPAPEPVTR